MLQSTSAWWMAGACALALCAPPAALAADEQVWTGAVASGPVGGELAIFVEGQTRWSNSASGVSQSSLRLGVGVAPRPGWSAYGGYARLRNTPGSGRPNDEDRLWLQASYPVTTVGRVQVTARTRLEARSRLGFDGDSLRLRQQVRGSLPLTASNSSLSAVIWGEWFVETTDAEWTREGLYQQRLFAGVSIPVRSDLSVEAGLLNRDFIGDEAPPDARVGLVSRAYRF